MEKQNKSVTGQISNLVDKWQVAMNNIGKSNEGLIYGSINMAATIVKNFEEIGKVIKDLVVAYGIYKTSLMSVSGIYDRWQECRDVCCCSTVRSFANAKQAQILADKGLIAGSTAYNNAVFATIKTQRLKPLLLPNQPLLSRHTKAELTLTQALIRQELIKRNKGN